MLNRNSSAALIGELVSALQSNLAPYAPSSLNTAPPKLNTASAIDAMLGTRLNRSQADIYSELANIINTAYQTAMSDQASNERAFIQALANVADAAQDTMRTQYGADAATGANRGMYAADILSAILGMQNTSVEGVNELFGNRSALLNQRANDLAGAASDAQSTYDTLQQYLAEYSKSLYETDSTNHTTELASWNAYIDALMGALPYYLSDYGNSTNNVTVNGDTNNANSGGTNGTPVKNPSNGVLSAGSNGISPYGITALKGKGFAEALFGAGGASAPFNKEDSTEEHVHGGGGRRRDVPTTSTNSSDRVANASKSPWVGAPSYKDLVTNRYNQFIGNNAAQTPAANAFTVIKPNLPTMPAPASADLIYGALSNAAKPAANSTSAKPALPNPNVEAFKEISKAFAEVSGTPSKPQTSANTNAVLNAIKSNLPTMPSPVKPAAVTTPAPTVNPADAFNYFNNMANKPVSAAPLPNPTTLLGNALANTIKNNASAGTSAKTSTTSTTKGKQNLPPIKKASGTTGGKKATTRVTFTAF